MNIRWHLASIAAILLGVLWLRGWIAAWVVFLPYGVAAMMSAYDARR